MSQNTKAESDGFGDEPKDAIEPDMVPEHDSSRPEHKNPDAEDEERRTTKKRKGEGRKMGPSIPASSRGFESYLLEEQARLAKLPEISRIPNLLSTAYDTLKWIIPLTWVFALKKSRGEEQHPFYTLYDCDGHLTPGTMTLVMAPPGHGKSTLMKVLSGRLNSKNVEGEVLYSGKRQEDMSSTLQKLVAYVGQDDIHLPFLTVRETLQFAVDTLVIDDKETESMGLSEARKRRVDTFLRVLGLEECADTFIGDEIVKGISGGQKKRVTIGEMLVSNARAMVLDELKYQITTGLDSAVAFEIISSIQTWCKTTKGTVLTALLQPPPEVFALFDKLILMREGRIVYNGKREKVFDYLSELGIQIGDDDDEAHFLSRFLMDPDTLRQAKGVKSNVCWDTKFLVDFWGQQSGSYSSDDSEHQETLSEGETTRDTGKEGFLYKQYELKYPHAWPYLVYSCVKRQVKLTVRNLQLYGFRLARAAMVGLILGSLFWDLDNDEFGLKLGVLTFSIICLGFGNVAEIPEFIKQRQIVQKQAAATFYPTSAYTVAVAMMHVPLAVLETLIMGTIVYWMMDFASDGGRFLFFLLILFLVNMVMNLMFRIISYPSPTMEVAETQGGPVIGIMMVFGGFLVPKQSIPNGLNWLYWISSFSWTTTSLMQNELGDEKFSKVVPGTGMTLEEIGLETFGIPTNDRLKLGAVGVLLLQFGAFFLAMTLVLKYYVFDTNRGSARMAESEPSTAISSANWQSVSGSMHFVPQTLSFRNVSYSVRLPSKEWKTLLQTVSGVAYPGRLTGLMGASGSGKSTLMDVLVGRKSHGSIAGDVFVNGYPKDDDYYRRLVGYVEQFDHHIAFCTVSESLEYAAELRLPDALSSAERKQIVEEVLQLMELNALRNSLVGTPGQDDGGLSPGERKRLTIGVELIANPSIIFLDEPTTGLDSRAALSVMRVIRKIVDTGRTVVCTIHQPSSELFELFDDLILLQRGGYEVYSGPIGYRGKEVKEYFTSHGARNPHRGENVADWVLELLLMNATTSESGEQNNQQNAAPTVHFGKLYDESDMKESIDRAVQATLENQGSNPFDAVDSKYARGYLTQLRVTLGRTFRSYWRNIDYNWVRIFVLALLGILFGATFYDIEKEADDASGVLSLSSLIFTSIAFASATNFLNVLPLMSRERATYYREVSSNTYYSSVYSLALTIVELPYNAVVTLAFGTIYYFMAGFSNDAGNYWHSMFAQFLAILSMNYSGMLFASALPDVESANAVGYFYVTLCFLFGGVFIDLPSIPDGWTWFYYTNPIAYGTNIFASIQLYCEGNQCPTMTIVDPEQGTVEVDRYDYALENYDFDYDRRWEFTGYLLLLIVVIRLLGILSLKHMNHMRR